jgi:hypothetical protein
MTKIHVPGQEPVKERRVTISLSDEEIELIAEKAAEKAVAKMTATVYQEVGKGVINKIFWIIGVSAVGVYVFLQNKGVLK